jgi:hypothetical protein
MFQAIQFGHRGLTSSMETLAPYFGSSRWRVHENSNSWSLFSCSTHPRSSFQICNTKGLILKRHHATTVKIIINKKKSRQPTIPTKLVHKHAKKILRGNGKAITNFNILAKTNLVQHFCVPYLHTFSIAGSRIDGLKIVF